MLGNIPSPQHLIYYLYPQWTFLYSPSLSSQFLYQWRAISPSRRLSPHHSTTQHSPMTLFCIIALSSNLPPNHPYHLLNKAKTNKAPLHIQQPLNCHLFLSSAFLLITKKTHVQCRKLSPEQSKPTHPLSHPNPCHRIPAVSRVQGKEGSH